MGISVIVLMYALWSSIFSLAKIGLQYSPPIFLTATRMLIAGAALLFYLLFAKRSSFKLSSKQWMSMFLLGFFSIYLTNVLEFWALQYLSSAKACFIYSLSPFFTALFSYFHFGEKMNGRKWLGFIIGFAGVIPTLALQTGQENSWSSLFFLSYPTVAMIGATLASVYGWVLLRLMVKDHQVSPLMANGSSMLIGGTIALIHSMVVEPWSPSPVAGEAFVPFIGWACLMGLISNVICYNLYGVMLKKYTATFLSFLGLLSPLFASLHGWVFLGEVPSGLIFTGAAIVSIGLWIVYSTELKQGYVVLSEPTTARRSS